MNQDEFHKLRVEIYNIVEKGRAIGTGWCAVKWTLDGRRCNVLKDFFRDESACRAYVELWNGPGEWVGGGYVNGKYTDPKWVAK